MKPLLTAIAALFLLLPALAFAGYVIHLKDGTQFVTDQYFEEGDQIKFKRYGGLVGIEKDRIREIEKTEDLPEAKKPPSETEAPPAKQETGEQDAPQEKAKRKETQQKGAADKNDAKKDPKIIEQFEALEEKYEYRKNMPVNLLIELKNELTVLRDTIISSYPEEEYSVELRKIADMRFFLTDMILRKSRNK